MLEAQDLQHQEQLLIQEYKGATAGSIESPLAINSHTLTNHPGFLLPPGP